MMWLYLIALAIIGAIIVVLTGTWSGASAPAEESAAATGDDIDQLLQDVGPQGLSAQDLDEVEFDSAVRGYRMDQVDKLLNAMAAQLRRRPDRDDISTE